MTHELINYQAQLNDLLNTLSPREKLMMRPSESEDFKEIANKLESLGFVRCSGGDMEMGTDSGLVSTIEVQRKNEMPRRRIAIPSFYVAKLLVSNSDYEKFDTRYLRPPTAPYNNSPATCISYGRVVSYINWLNKETGMRFRLPTEPEAVLSMAPPGWMYSYQENGEPVREDQNVSFSFPGKYPEGVQLSTIPVDDEDTPKNYLGLIHPTGNVSIFTLGHYKAGGYWGAIENGAYAIVVGGNFRQCPLSARVVSRGIIDVAMNADTVGIRLFHSDPCV